MSILTTKSNDQLKSEELAAHQRDQQARTPVVNRLSMYVDKAFRDAEMHRQTTGITERLLKCRRLRDGKYDAATIAAINAKGGCATFFNITEPKCEGFESWMGEVFAAGGDDRPWDCKPTPIPTLPKESAAQVVEMTVAQFSAMPEDGAPIDPEVVAEYAQALYDDTLKLLFEDASKRCERMVTKMADQASEGGFLEAITEFIRDFSMYMTAFFKGPVLTRKDRIGWKDGKVQKVSEIIPTWSSPDPNDIYPGPNSRSIDESYICERVNYDRRKLSEMRGVDGWSTEAIEAVLGMGPTPQLASNDMMNLAGESERAIADNRDQTVNNGLPDATLSGIEFWGSVQGSMLTEWGMKGVEDPFKFYEVHCVMINKIVIRTVMNADPLGRRPYFAACVSKNKGSIWGHSGIPERMEDCQDAVNGSCRNLINNLAMASGPMVAADLDLMPPELHASIHKIYPWRVFPYRGNKSPSSRPPITFFQPNSNASELIAVSDHFTQLADERTNVPRYTTGSAEVGGAGETASGLGMLMDASTRGLKRHVKSIDNNVMRPAIERLFTWNMLYLDDPSLKGDVQVVPRGALAMLTRQQTQLRRQEFLNMTINDIDMQIIGMEGRATVLREIAKGLDLPVDKIVPDEETLRARFQQGITGQEPPPEDTGDGDGDGEDDDEEAA